MKKILLSAVGLMLAVSLNAQVSTPQPSPTAKLEQPVGLTQVTLEYSRPGVKGRTVFGDLVPYGKIWRTGANKNSIITFSDDVEVAGYEVKAGSYAIFTKPGESLWEIYLYSDTNNWGNPEKWDESKVVAIAKAQVHPIPFNVETFTMDINNIKSSEATLEFIWEKTYVAVPFTVPTDKKVMASINDALSGSPKANDYYAAAAYYYSENKDIEQAKEWIDKAMSMNEKPQFWQYRQQSLIYAKAGDKDGAIGLAKKSMQAAKEAGNDDYVKMNMDSLKEWGAM
ncbi:DUF2911 domain-containing protein [Mangrovimonas sp. AS39]|uniref:DUF2911 domain-containing protein n=1 Tax=Mangrovimonas TaxID=1211036 RepID=UPI0014232EA0|nr:MULTISPECIES: DUF2911 domain-containing protein [Mangrovimonas]MCF1192691.1 DUF2911 domain-containing protein [Mangrovimonas futianensis]MCF1196388.1 DUF2911 domain-containing protein [Mangrovimonas futianensis]NIK92126.1 DUF2911 domain-containing protein [Mangrovimonas sp. CR14]